MPFLELPDATIYYETAGEGDPLILIPGFASGIWSWKYQIDELASDFELIVFDPRGIGRSTMADSAEVTLRVLAADIVALLDDLGKEKANILGISFGGFVAQSFALLHPERLERLVLAFTSYGGEGHVPPPQDILEAFSFDSGLNSADRIRHHLSMAFSHEFLVRFPDRVADYCRLREENHVPEGVYLGQLTAAMGFDHSVAASAIAAETLVITGDKDLIVPAQNSVNLANAIQGAAFLMMQDAGHMFFVEHPAEFNAAVRDFLKR